MRALPAVSVPPVSTGTCALHTQSGASACVLSLLPGGVRLTAAATCPPSLLLSQERLRAVLRTLVLQRLHVELRHASSRMESSDAEPQQDGAQQETAPQTAAEPRKRFSLLSGVNLRQPAEPQPDLTVQVRARLQDPH